MLQRRKEQEEEDATPTKLSLLRPQVLPVGIESSAVTALTKNSRHLCFNHRC